MYRAETERNIELELEIKQKKYVKWRLQLDKMLVYNVSEDVKRNKIKVGTEKKR